MNLSSDARPVTRSEDPRAIELRAVLGDDPALVALLASARDTYAQSGSWTSKTIPLTTPELRAAAKGLGVAKVGDRLAMQKLGEVLSRTRFRCTVEEAVRWAFGDIPPTRDQRRETAVRVWEAQRDQLVSLAGDAAREVSLWLETRATRLQRDWTDPSIFDTAKLAVRAASATKALSGPEVVPVLANRLCGDPHALDLGLAARRYFEHILVCRHDSLGYRHPLRAGQRAALLAASNLAADGISSQVWAVGLVSTDPMVAAARERGHVIGLPLVTLAAITDVAAYANIAYAVENRSVFGALLPTIAALSPERRPTVVCTSGNPSLAARVLLQRLAAAGVTVCYGGDTDARGRMISDAIAALVGDRYRPWHMDGPPGEVRYQESSLATMADDLRRVGRQGAST